MRATVPEGLSSLSGWDLTQYARERVGAAPDGGGRHRPKVNVLEGKLAAAELQDLLRFALHEQEFFAFDQAAVRAEVKAAVKKRYHTDGTVRDNNDDSTTALRIQTADRNHEVKWPRLDKSIWDCPGVQRLRQLRAVEVRVAQRFYVLLAGGPQRVEAVAEQMDQLVRPYYLLYPHVGPLTVADFRQVGPSPDGPAERFTFTRYNDKFDIKPLFEVSVDVPPVGRPTLAYVIPPQ
jgi:hypothetical protein